MPNTLIYACVGGIDPAEAIPVLQATHDADVVAVVIDLDHGRAADGLRARALTSGAVRCHVIDGRDTFAEAFVRPAVQAGALAGEAPASLRALVGPFVAQALVRVARLEQARLVAHGETGAQADRIDTVLRALDASLVRVPVAGRPAAGPAAEAPTRRADRAAAVEVAFERGVPVRLNGIPMPLAELFESLDTMAAAQGLPRRASAAAPVVADGAAMAILQAAHDALRRMAAPTAGRVSAAVALDYAAIVDRGDWFGPTRAALDAFVDALQPRVCGTVQVALAEGAWRLDRVALDPADAALEPVLK